MISALKSLPFDLNSSTFPLFKKGFDKVYRLACAIFGEMFILGYFGAALISFTFCHLPCFPSSIPLKYLKVSSQNRANWGALKQCIRNNWNPIPKNIFESIGRREGLRVPHDISYSPVNACLGTSLLFLSLFAQETNLDSKEKLFHVAKILKSGAPVAALKAQAIYEDLLGFNGFIKSKDMVLYRRLLKGEEIHEPLELSSIIQSFMNNNKLSVSLREFIFSELEKQGKELTTDAYALILELDATWRHLKNPLEKKNDFLHNMIIGVIAKSLNLEILQSQRFEKENKDIVRQLEKLTSGLHLIQFKNHTVALVKTENDVALFDSSVGLGLFNFKNQQEVFSHFLAFYSGENSVSAKLLSFQLSSQT
jgi:hypothetical protein